jgi:hypothetical protein
MELAIACKSSSSLAPLNQRSAMLTQSFCRAINTYHGQGVSKRDWSKEEREAHTIIYMSDTTPIRLEGEEMMTKKPIEVHKASADQKLDPASRINFGRVYAVLWDVKVMNIGKVAEDSMPHLLGYYTNSLG